MHPKAFGIKAFDLGSHGRVQSVAIQNKRELNLTAYAVADATNLCVTVINKEHGANGRDAKVRILSPGFDPRIAEVMFLTAGDGGVEATNGVTLGGSAIVNNAPWVGTWTAVVSNKECIVAVPVASAAVFRFSR
jgi:hypothetical protein